MAEGARKIQWTSPKRPGLVERKFVEHNPDGARVYAELKNKKSALSVCLRETVKRITHEE